MSKPKPTQATEKGQGAMLGNRRPATLEIEFAEGELDLHIYLKPFDCCIAEDGKPKQVRCELTSQSFTVFKGQLVYHIYAAASTLEGYLHPETVAQGVDFIRERILHKAMLSRDNALWSMMDAVRLEAIADRPIEIKGVEMDYR